MKVTGARQIIASDQRQILCSKTCCAFDVLHMTPITFKCFGEVLGLFWKRDINLKVSHHKLNDCLYSSGSGCSCQSYPTCVYSAACCSLQMKGWSPTPPSKGNRLVPGGLITSKPATFQVQSILGEGGLWQSPPMCQSGVRHPSLSKSPRTGNVTASRQRKEVGAGNSFRARFGASTWSMCTHQAGVCVSTDR